MIVFRCDASPQIGIGHLVRCRTLASALRNSGEVSVMIGPSHEYTTSEDNHLFTDWIAKSSWSTSIDDATFVAQTASRYSDTTIILDDYRIDEAYQLVLHSNGLKWLQFDGATNQALWADFVLNTSPHANLNDYTLLSRTHRTKFLLGTKYALIREEFLCSSARTRNTETRTILLMFGGGDDRGAILFVLQNLLANTACHIHFMVVVGPYHPKVNQLNAWINGNLESRVELLVDPPSIATIMHGCDLAIMAGGGTTYEAAYCGIPMILIAIAENQVTHSIAWEKIGAAKFLGRLADVTPKSLISSVKYAFDGKNQNRSESPQRIVDGLGAKRVSEILLGKML